MDNKFLITGLFFAFIGFSGFWLSHIGKPFHVLLLTVHKLISLAALVYLVVTLYRIHQVTPLSPAAVAASAVSIVFFIGLIVTGGLSSIAKPMPGIVTIIHHIVPYLAVISTAAALYFTLVRKI